VRLATFSRMDLAQGRTSLYVSAENGAASPGRWQPAQFLKKIGATSLLKVRFLIAELVSVARLAGDSSRPAASNSAGGAVAGGIIGAATGAIIGSQMEPRRPGYYHYHGDCWRRWPDGSYHRVHYRYCR